MVAAGFDHYENGTYVNSAGEDIKNDPAYAVQTGVDFRARYFLQRDYVDNVEQYGWSMGAATSAAYADAERNVNLALQMGGMTPELLAQYEVAGSLLEFGKKYDAALYGGVEQIPFAATQGLLNKDVLTAYDSVEIFAANQMVFDNWSQTNGNPLYSFIEDGTFRPVIGPSNLVNLTTKAFYPSDNPRLEALGLSGRPHGQWRGGIAADIGTQENNFPVYLMQPETILAQRSALAYDEGAGLTAITQTRNFLLRYSHMQENTIAYNTLKNLLNQAISSQVYRVPLPPGYQIGNVGNTGRFTTSEHLHWEWIPQRR